MAFTGIPEFIVQPPSTININEGSNLAIRVQTSGNPKPSVHFKWTHLPTSSATIVPSVKLYPFVYSSTYSLNNIDGSYCGRILHTTIKNSIGSSRLRGTNVNVLCRYIHGRLELLRSSIKRLLVIIHCQYTKFHCS